MAEGAARTLEHHPGPALSRRGKMREVPVPAGDERVSDLQSAPIEPGLPLRPEHVLALQRSAGNQAVQALLRDGGGRPRPRGVGVAATRGPVLQRQIDATVAALGARATAIAQTLPPAQGQAFLQDAWNLAWVLRQFDAWMRGNRIAYRIGGSVSAFLQGAGRVPVDIDVEVANPNEMQRLAGLVQSMGGGWRGVAHMGAHGQVVVLNAIHSIAPNYTFDMVSEADPALNSPMEVREGMEVSHGDFGPTGGLVPWQELVINYLNRMQTKPAVAVAKNDVAQIQALLLQVRSLTLQDHWAHWRHSLLPRIPNHADQLRLRPYFQAVVGGPEPAPHMMAVG